MKRPYPLLAILLLLTGCGGGQSAAPTTAAASAKLVNGSVVLSIPLRGSSATARYPQFVSPNASSVTIALNGGTPQTFDVSAASSLCTTTAGTRTCTLSVGAPSGTDSFAIVIYAGANGTGTVLATATSSTTVAAGTPFTLSIAMNAAIGTVVFTIPNSGGTAICPDKVANTTGVVEGCAGSSGTVTFSAFDPSGAPITGTAPFASPITFTFSDPSVTVSPLQITALGQPFVLSYSGAAFGPTIQNSIAVTASAGGQTVASGSLTVVRQYLYVANSNAAPGTTPAGGGNVVGYTFGANGSATPARTISGPNTNLSNPVAIVEDSLNNLYVLDNGPYTTHSNPLILVFAAGNSGNAVPLRQITQIAADDGNVACEDLAFDPTGQFLFVTCDDAKIHVFPSTANSIAVAVETAVLSYGSFVHPVVPAFDPVGNLYVSDPGSNDIFEFPSPPTSGGAHTISPTLGTMSGATSSWPSTIAPLGMAIDPAGTLFASIVYFNSTAGAQDAGNEIAMWPTATLPCTNCAPGAALGGTPLSTHVPGAFAFDGAGNMYVANPFTNQISVFARSVVAGAGNPTLNPAPLRTINTGSSPGAPGGLVIGQ
jgi:hypothetical protein